MLTVSKLKELRKKAEESVADMPDNELKSRAFNVILNYILNSEAGIEPAKKVEGGNSSIKPKQRTILTKEAKGEKIANKRTVNYIEIVQKVMDCAESDGIEKNILNRGSQVDRALLPLYIVHEYFGNAYGLTTGDINKISTELGIPLSTANASHTMTGTARKYVIATEMKKKGRPQEYKLHRKGIDYLKSVISGTSDEK